LAKKISQEIITNFVQKKALFYFYQKNQWCQNINKLRDFFLEIQTRWIELQYSLEKKA
jgi:hypothetical protein